MNEALKKVLNWQSIFGRREHIVSDAPTSIDPNVAEFRADFLIEEIREYLAGNSNKDLVEILDALCDIQYFLYGTVVIHGLQDIFDEAFSIVHDSNMSKLDKEGKVIIRESDGKILKGDQYWSPKKKLEELLKNWQAEHQN